MELFDVYPRFDITPVSAEGCWITDLKGDRYLDLYGGHAVISIGHSHPEFVQNLATQLGKIAFYSNSVQNPLQEELADRLGRAAGLEAYQLFLCNSGAEANENALKLASFHTGKSRVIAFRNSFHGRTSAAVAATDNPAIISPLNALHEVTFLPLNDVAALENALSKKDISAVILEPIQGVGGLQMAEPRLWKKPPVFAGNTKPSLSQTKYKADSVVPVHSLHFSTAKPYLELSLWLKGWEMAFPSEGS